MNLTQNWVGYLQRSYQQIKASLISRLPPEITDHSESNDLIIILSHFAGVAEMINLWIDRMGEEAFLGTARRFSSVVRLAKTIGYLPQAANPSSGYLQLTVTDSVGVITPLNTTVIIPASTKFKSIGDLIFTSTQAITLPIGTTIASIPVAQFEDVANTTLGISNGAANQTYSLGYSYVQNSLSITIGPDTYTQIESLALALSTSKVFTTEVNESGEAIVKFGDGTNGTIPPNTITIFGDYKITSGSIGNLPPNSITEWVGAIPAPSGYKFPVANPNYTTSGYGYDTIEDIRRKAPLSLRTLNRAVTHQDYIDLALLVPGVGSASLRACCGKCITLLIGPTSKGIASSQLLQNTLDFFQCKKLLGRCVKVEAAGITRIWVEAKVKTRYGVTVVNALDSIAETFENSFGYTVSKPNRAINLSDLIAALDNNSSIDYVEILTVWAEPYARPIGTAQQLNWVREIISNPIINLKHSWTLVYSSATLSFALYKDNLLITNVPLGLTYTDPDLILTLTINPGPYSNGDKWEFVTYPPNTNIPIDDNTIPIIDVDFTPSPASGFYEIIVDSTQVTTACNTPC